MALMLGILAALPLQAQEPLKNNDVVAVCGDSITAGGYVLYIDSYLTMCYRGGPVRTLKCGWPGDSMGSFWGRKCGALPVLAAQPTVATLLYGMNDAVYKAYDENRAQAYRNGLVRLVRELKSKGVREVVVSSPTVVDTGTYPERNGLNAQEYNLTLAKMGELGRQVAQEEGTGYLDLHRLMLEVMKKAKEKYGQRYQVSGKDGVHPAANGNLVIAYALLKALGCDGEIGTLRLDLANGKSASSEGHTVLRFQNGEAEIESSRYPFCFTGKPDDPSATSGIIEFFPFNEDLNRFRLMVSGVESQAQVRVAWGKTAKNFSGAALASGINLAAEFPENPFQEPFRKVYWVIMDQKGKWETRQYMHLLSQLPQVMEDLKRNPEELKPDRQADLRAILAVDPQAGVSQDRLQKAILERDRQLAEAVRKVFVPVRHTIRLEVLRDSEKKTPDGN